MKIVFISSRALENIGGIENYMKNLCPRLASMGHEIILYTEGDKYSKKVHNGVTIITSASIKSKFFNKILISMLATFHSLLFNRKVDVYHYNAVAAAIFSIFPLILGETVVYQGHGFEWKRAKWSKLIRTFIRLLERFVILINKNFTMVSEEQSEYIRSFGKKCTTITPGIDITNVQFDSDLFNRYHIKKNEYILFLGRLVPEKKCDILIEAFNKLENENEQLVIAGDDPNEKNYIALLKNLAKDNKNIIFTGAVYNEDKEAFLQHCKIFCIPSELEGLPITLLEAMSYKKICVASDIKSNIEALGDTGVYFELNNVEDLAKKMSEILKNQENFLPLGGHAFQRVKERFTWSQIAIQFDKYYNMIKKGE